MEITARFPTMSLQETLDRFLANSFNEEIVGTETPVAFVMLLQQTARTRNLPQQQCVNLAMILRMILLLLLQHRTTTMMD